MPYLSEADKQNAREMDLLTYLQLHEPDNLVRVSGNEYCTKEHDSLRISNGKWMWYSHGFGGKSALDYLTKVKGIPFYSAAKLILDDSYSHVKDPPFEEQKQNEKSKKEFTLPTKSFSNQRIIRYLTGRGISKTVIDYCIDHGFLYQSYPKNNCVFVGKDENDIPRYAGLRGTTPTRFMGDVAGSDKAFSFRLVRNNSKDVHIFECAIDLLSYATLLEMMGCDWKDYSLLALAGVAQKPKNENDKIPVSIANYISSNPNLDRVYLHLDNDDAGRNEAEVIMKNLSDRFTVINKTVPVGKDVNDYLMAKLGISQIKPEQVKPCR